MIKRYSSPCVKFAVNVKKDGKSIAVVFDRYNQDDKRRFVLVSDPEIQKQMESKVDFNVYYKLDFSIAEESDSVNKEITQPNLDSSSKELLSKHFKTGTEAKLWLNMELKVPTNKLTNKEKMKTEALLLGFIIEFENE